MAESTIVKTKRDGTISFADLGASNSYTVAYEAGDLSIDIPGPTITSSLDRGIMAATPSLRYGDDQPMTGSFTAQLRDISDATDQTLFELIAKSGAIGGWTSTLGANAEVAAVTLTFTIEGSDHGDSGGDHIIVCNHCVVTGGISEGDPSTISISFTSYDLYPTCT